MKTCSTLTNIKQKLSNRDGYPSSAGRCNVLITNTLQSAFGKLIITALFSERQWTTEQNSV